jgi:hypothetical protein
MDEQGRDPVDRSPVPRFAASDVRKPCRRALELPVYDALYAGAQRRRAT